MQEDNKTNVTVSSYSPGRVRLRLDLQAMSVPDLKQVLEISSVQEVRFKKITGSMLILYNADQMDLKGLMDQLEHDFPTFQVKRPEMGAFDTEFPKTLPLAMLFHYFDNLERELHDQTSGKLDLKNALMIFYVVLGVAAFLRAPTFPKWTDFYREVAAMLRQYHHPYQDE